MQVIANSRVFIGIILPVGPLLDEECAKGLECGGGELVGVLLHGLDNLLRLVDERAPALGHQAPGQFNLIHLLRLITNKVKQQAVVGKQCEISHISNVTF